MTCLTVLTADELLQKLAVYNNHPDNLAATRAEILRRMARVSQIRHTDRKLIEQIIKKAKAIEDADSDLSHQSQRMRRLGEQYHKLKRQLMDRMQNGNGVVCKTA